MIRQSCVRKTEVTELLQVEIPDKQTELGADAPLKRVLQSLMSDAGLAWKTLMPFAMKRQSTAGYPYRFFAPGNYEDPDRGFFARILASVELSGSANVIAGIRELMSEAGEKSFRLACGELPGSSQAHRLRVVTAAVPSLLPEHLTRSGIGSRRFDVWRLLWLNACGEKAPAIAKAVQPKFDLARAQYLAEQWDEKSLSDADIKRLRKQHYIDNPVVERNQIFRIRDRAYNALVERIGPHLNQRTAA